MKIVFFVFLFLLSLNVQAQVEIIYWRGDTSWTFKKLVKEVENRTSLQLEKSLRVPNERDWEHIPWLWTDTWSEKAAKSRVERSEKAAKSRVERSERSEQRLAQWIRKGGMLIVEGDVVAGEEFTKRMFGSEKAAKKSTSEGSEKAAESRGVERSGVWRNIPLDHELMRSFYLLQALPLCAGKSWRGFIFAGRLAIVTIPYSLLGVLRDGGKSASCVNSMGREMHTRLFVNLVMVALATDYKKDQIHLPEILKRLR